MCFGPHHGIGEIVLRATLLIARNDVAILIDKARFPVVPAYDVGDIFPGVALGWVWDFRKWIDGRLAIEDWIELPGMTRLGE
jgi:hypothetical protein